MHKFKTTVEKLEVIVGEMRPLSLLGMPEGEGGRPIINPNSHSFNIEFFFDKVGGTNKIVSFGFSITNPFLPPFRAKTTLALPDNLQICRPANSTAPEQLLSTKTLHSYWSV